MAIANAEMAAAWDGDEGAEWARHWERYDLGIAAMHRTLLNAAAVRAGEAVLDIGCGNGQTTRDAARAAAPAAAVGVDLSGQMLARASELAETAGIDNVRFEHADAQVYPFEPASFDIVLSRFGAMFFADPVAAFRNVHRATGSGGRLVMLSWRSFDDNEWLRCIVGALSAGRQLPTPPMSTPGPFGLADPTHVRATLAAAGYENVDLQAVDEPWWAGADADDAYAFASELGVSRGLLQGLDAELRNQALGQLRATLQEHAGADGVAFGSAAWLISARH